MAVLDFSADKQDASNETVGSHDLQALVDKASLGTRTGDGMYEVKDWEFARKRDDDTDDVIAQALSEKDDQPFTHTLTYFLRDLFRDVLLHEVLLHGL